MSKTIRMVISIGTLILAMLVGLVDVLTGIPDFAILYLIPIIPATLYIGFGYGFFIATISVVAEFSYHTLRVVGPSTLTVDIVFHSLAYIFIALLIGALFGQIRKIRELEQKRSLDLNIAKEIQKSIILPFRERHKDLTIATKIAFVNELGGDYYRFSIAEDKLFFCIADISGKSIAASLFSALLSQNIVDSLAESSDLSALIQKINLRMQGSLPEDMFVTLFCSFIDDKTITYINAGHESPLLFSKQNNAATLLNTQKALPIGIQFDLKIESKIEPFAPGDILLAVTDGVTGSSAFKDSTFEKLESFIYDSKDSSPQKIVNSLYKQAGGDNPKNQLDDIIIVCIKRQP